MRITALLVTLAVAAGAFGADSSALRRTKADLRAISTATESYFTDNNEYPRVKTIEELRAKISPVYIKTMPTTDGWGTPFAYRASGGEKGHYRVASAGPDRKFDPTTLDLNKQPAKSDDVVYSDVELIRP